MRARDSRIGGVAALAAVALVAIALTAMTSCSSDNGQSTPEERLEQRTRFMMGTYVTIHARGGESPAGAIELALDRMAEIDEKFNVTNPGSPLYAFNHEGVPVTDEEILDVVRAGMEITEATDGAFDATILPLVELWGFDGDAPSLPAAEQIEDCMASVGHQFVSIENGALRKSKEGVRIDLGGIAKGYAVAEGVAILREQGVTEALVDAGGDIFALGRRGGGPWKVGIRDPRGDGVIGYLEVDDMAVMGSGDYERFFIHEGKRYHHIFDPKTGYPTEELTGITVISPDPTLADAWATALLVMGPESGLRLAEELPGLEAILVTTSGEVLYTSGMATELKPLPEHEKGVMAQ